MMLRCRSGAFANSSILSNNKYLRLHVTSFYSSSPNITSPSLSRNHLTHFNATTLTTALRGYQNGVFNSKQQLRYEEEEQEYDEEEEEKQVKKQIKRWSYFFIYPFALLFGIYTIYSDESSARMIRTLYKTIVIMNRYRNFYKEQQQQQQDGTEDSIDNELKISQFHSQQAREALQLVLENGGIFVKMGQTIASLSHILPKEWISVFEACQDSVKYQDYDTIAKVFYNEFGKMPLEVFEEFDTVPIACASLAQVHRAKLKETGEIVAVKIQYHDLQRRLDGDLYYLGLMRGIMEWFIQKTTSKDGVRNSDISVAWLLDDFHHNLKIELDFEQEARNCDLFRTLFNRETGENITAPKVYWNHTSKRVITMEYIDGFKLNQVTDDREKKRVSQLLSEAYGKQLFTHGIVHVDPHPGNIFVRRRGQKDLQLVFLDHGLYRVLDPVLRLHYSKLYIALVTGDIDSIGAYAHQFYNTKGRCENPYLKESKKVLFWKSPSEFVQLFASMILSFPYHLSMTKQDEKKNYGIYYAYRRSQPGEVRQYAVDHLYDMIEILSQLPSDMLLLMKTSELLRSLFFVLDGHKDVSTYPSIFAKYAQSALQEHSYQKLSLSKRQQVEQRKISAISAWIQLYRKHIQQSMDYFMFCTKLYWSYLVYKYTY